jgi:mannose-1-phosphate guanylyltransferase/mannose-6-phosphate isomerase
LHFVLESPMTSNTIQVTPVILCGVSGTRLWPLSWAGFPKRFPCLTGDQSLFQLAARRLADLGAPDIEVAAPTIVCGEEHRLLAAEQLKVEIEALKAEAGKELDSCLKDRSRA